MIDQSVQVFAFLASTLFVSSDKTPTLETSPDKTSLWLYFAFGVANFL